MKLVGRLLGRWSARLAVSLLSFAACLLFSQTKFWQHLEGRLYDQLVVQTAPNQANLPITIIGIDEDTLNKIDACWPLPHRYHQRILERLTEAGASVVAFDLLINEGKSAESNLDFAGSLLPLAPVVLAADMGFTENVSIRQWFRIDPGKMFIQAGGTAGFAGMTLDDDATQRKMPNIEDSLGKRVVEVFEQKNPGIAKILSPTDDMLIRFLGGPHTFTYIPYHHLLDPEKYLPTHWREFLTDNIVLIGRNMNVTQEVGYSQAEAYQTPFFSKTKEFMPRVEIHANVIANLIEGNTLRSAPPSWTYALWCGLAAIATILMFSWHLVLSAIVAAVVIALSLWGEWWLFMNRNIWLPALGPASMVLVMYISQGLLAFVGEKRQRQEIRNAFSKYVSPAVVESMIADPDRLKLGGERKELTVLFTDLAGFTSIAENLDPETTAAVLNEHLAAMTDTVLKHGGTVDKFIGDAVMAFWGAPVDNPQQSLAALHAAMEMQERMAQQREQIRNDHNVELRLRIGIHRGNCIVGNMGGSNRFDYTVIGDTVNLASRLEGVNKIYGTDILVSDSLAAAVGKEIQLREVDSVRVKGKHLPVTILTPCQDAQLINESDEALTAYRAGQLEKARQCWESILNKHPEDTISDYFLHKLKTLEGNFNSTTWDGINVLDSK